jgi:hypothetical protein
VSGGGLGLGLQRLGHGSKVGRFVRGREWPSLTKPLDRDPSHEAGKRRESTLLGMGGDTGQLEDLVGNLGIELRRANLGASAPRSLGKAAAKRLEPGIHVAANYH